jgi:hypothetical protein
VIQLLLISHARARIFDRHMANLTTWLLDYVPFRNYTIFDMFLTHFLFHTKMRLLDNVEHRSWHTARIYYKSKVHIFVPQAFCWDELCLGENGLNFILRAYSLNCKRPHRQCNKHIYVTYGYFGCCEVFTPFALKKEDVHIGLQRLNSAISAAIGFFL